MKIHYLFAVLLIMGQCKPNIEKNNTSEELELPQIHHQFDLDSISVYYIDETVIIFNGKILQGWDTILEELQKLDQIIYSLTDKTIEHDSVQYFESGNYLSGEGISYSYITGWNQKRGKTFREIEIIWEYERTTGAVNRELDAARDKWMSLSNAHIHEQLVSELYGDSGIYVSGGKVSRGIQEISERYRYMSNPNWKIELHPLMIKQVNPGNVFEIGQYVSSGVGHYVIVWELRDDDGWKVLLDFNF